MDNKCKAFALILTVIVALSCLSLLTAKPANAQSNKNPSVSILYPTDSTTFNVSIEGVYFQLLYQTNDKLSWAGFSVNGGANVTCTGNVTDYTQFLDDGYQFDFGHPNLTLYANDTSGNWAIPQTVTYTVYFYPDTVSAPSTVPTSASPTPSTVPSTPESNSSLSQNLESPSPSPTQSPPVAANIPEYSWLVTAPLLLSVLPAVVILRHRKLELEQVKHR